MAIIISSLEPFATSIYHAEPMRTSLNFQAEDMARLKEQVNRNTYIAQETEMLDGREGNTTVTLQNELEQLEKEFARLLEKHQELQEECAGRWRRVRAEALVYRKTYNSQRKIKRCWNWLKSLFKRS